MSPLPLEYGRAKTKPPYGKATFISLALAALGGPIGAECQRLETDSNAIFLILRFGPVVIAIVVGLWALFRIASLKEAGMWIVGLALLIDVYWFWFLCFAGSI